MWVRILQTACLAGVLCPLTTSAHQGAHQRLQALDDHQPQQANTHSVAMARAVALLEAGDANAAIEEVQRAEQLGAPRDAMLATRADAWRMLDQPERAEKDLSALIALAPNTARAYHERAELHTEAGRLRAARADWAKAFDLGPTPERILAWGSISQTLGEHRVTARGYRLAIATLKGPVVLRIALQDVERERERWDAALEQTDALLRLRPKQPDWLLTRSQLLERLGRGDEAHHSRQEALKYAQAAFHQRPTPQRHRTLVRAKDACARPTHASAQGSLNP